MFKKKCYKCGNVGSIHVKKSDTSKLIAAFGPYDDDGLRMYFIYCRICKFINIYKPGWIRPLVFNSLLDPNEVYENFKQGKISKEEMGIFAGNIQQALIEDGILPKDWIKV